MANCHNVGRPNQACTLHCTQPGLGTVSGPDYIKAGYLLDVDDLRRNFLVVLGWLSFFTFAQIVIEYEYVEVS